MPFMSISSDEIDARRARKNRVAASDQRPQASGAEAMGGGVGSSETKLVQRETNRWRSKDGIETCGNTVGALAR